MFYWSAMEINFFLLLYSALFKEIPGSKFWFGFLSWESNSKLDRVRMEEKNPTILFGC